ncbi:GSCOCG00002496001-RA-CDS, partial [Cotesia congregata]
YCFEGVERTFLSSISLFAALFFSALSWVVFEGFNGRFEGKVAVLSFTAAASTSTVATLQSPPPTIFTQH